MTLLPFAQEIILLGVSLILRDMAKIRRRAELTTRAVLSIAHELGADTPELRALRESA